MKLHVNISIDEYPSDHFKEEEVRNAIVKHVKEQLEKESKEVIEIFQQSKSDALGLGMYIRAYRNKSYKQPWREHFSSLDINAAIDVEIIQTGVLQ